MTGILANFEHDHGGPNLRDELAGAAWRFVLPDAYDRVEWKRDGVPGDDDLAALRRVTEVVEAPSADAGAFVGTPDGDVRPGIEFACNEGGVPLDLWYEGDRLRGVQVGGDDIARSILAGRLGPVGTIDRTLKQRLRRVPAERRQVRTGTLHGVAAPRPPDWLVAAAAGAGFDVADHRWALWCRGEFASQKLVLFLVAPGTTEPGVVVKITRDRRFNERLVNESRMLRRVHELDVDARGGAPAVLFTGEVWGSAVSAQSAVSGADLRAALRHRPELIDTVTAWLADMARASTTTANADELGEVLHRTIDRYIDAYPVPPSAHRFLRSQADLLATSGIDTVLQHGDPGPWNAVLTPSGEVAFLDWEAGEERGLPLWDLLYFLRSASMQIVPKPVWVSRRRRTRRDLIDGSDLTVTVSSHVRTYADAVGLDHTAIEPLVHLCWVHRAVKQARRLAPPSRARGVFHCLVLDGVAGREQPGFRQLALVKPTGGTG